MKSLLLGPLLLALAFADSNPNPEQKLNHKLDPDGAIFVGHVFWPPTMKFMAWLPAEQSFLEEWCYRATEASNNRVFSLGGIDGLELHHYFEKKAWITREGKPFADCFVTPESGRIGSCDGVLDFDCEGGQKFTGPGTRGWTCWVKPELRGNMTKHEPAKLDDKVTTDGHKPTAVTGAMLSNSIMGAFTPGITGA